MYNLIDTSSLSPYEIVCAKTQSNEPHPTQSQIEQLGTNIANELLQELEGTALEQFIPKIVEGVIGGLHSAALRLTRDYDRACDDIKSLMRDFDGSSVTDDRLHEANQKAAEFEAAVMITEIMRDAASDCYTTQTGESWSPWKGSAKNVTSTFAMVQARDVLSSKARGDAAVLDAGPHPIAFRGAPNAKRHADANAIYDTLNRAHSKFPDMTLIITGNFGAEKIAEKWAKQKAVKIILKTPDFDKFGKKRAPFVANDDILKLNPAAVVTFEHTLEPMDGETVQPAGYVANLGDKARGLGIPVLNIVTYHQQLNKA